MSIRNVMFTLVWAGIILFLVMFPVLLTWASPRWPPIQ